MKILYIGDIMAGPGHKIVSQLLPGIKQEFGIDFTIAQSENSNPNGKGPSKFEINQMQQYGIDFFTGGNHSLSGPMSPELYEDQSMPVVRPANLKNCPGVGYKVVQTTFGNILIASVLGQTVGKPIEIDNPLETVEKILKETSGIQIAARIINLHGDYSSEKRVFGYYLDGRFSAVVGDHWHVPTADAMVLPKGTAHITDVGMCGTLHSSLGVKTKVIISRWKNGKTGRNEIDQDGILQFNAVVIDVDTSTGLSRSITQVQRTLQQ